MRFGSGNDRKLCEIEDCDTDMTASQSGGDDSQVSMLSSDDYSTCACMHRAVWLAHGYIMDT